MYKKRRNLRVNERKRFIKLYEEETVCFLLSFKFWVMRVSQAKIIGLGQGGGRQHRDFIKTSELALMLISSFRGALTVFLIFWLKRFFKRLSLKYFKTLGFAYTVKNASIPVHVKRNFY